MAKPDFQDWRRRGFGDSVIPILPPDAQLDPSSHMPPQNRGKAPGRRKTPWSWVGFSGWETYAPSADDLTNWTQWGAGVGVRTAHLPAFDIDIDDEELVRCAQAAIFLELGKTPARTGAPPRVLLPYRLSQDSAPFRKRIIHLGRNGASVGAIELLASGQQFVAEGKHARTGNDYVWSSPLVLDELEEVSEEEFLSALRAAAEALRHRGVVVLESQTGGGEGFEPTPDMLRAPSHKLLEEALFFVPNDERVDYDDWVAMGAALRGASDNDPGWGLDLWKRWSNSGAWATSDDVLEAKWESFQHPRIGYEHIYNEAKERGWTGAAEAAFSVPPEREFKEKPRPQARGVVGSAKSQTNLGDRLAADWDRRLYIPEIKQWVDWDGSCWADVDTAEVEAEATEWLREQADTLAQTDASFEKLTSVAFANGVLIQATRRLSESIEKFDRDRSLLGFRGGVLNLKTGEVVPPLPSHRIRRQLGAAPDEKCPTPRFDNMMATMFEGDMGLCRYWLYTMASMLRGDEQSHKCFWLFGVPGSGKTTLVTLMRNLFGSYARAIDASLMTTKVRSSEVRYELAMMDGCRLIVNIEMQANAKVSGDFIKQTLGNEDAPISARLPYGQPFEIRPQWAMLVASNTLPEFSPDDAQALRRRVVPIPAMGKPGTGPLRGFMAALNAEMPGILSLILDYLPKYNSDGLPFLQQIEDELDAALEGLNTTQVFVETQCITGAGLEADRSDLYSRYEAWCLREDYAPQTKRSFANDLRKLGINPTQQGAHRGWRGVAPKGD